MRFVTIIIYLWAKLIFRQGCLSQASLGTTFKLILTRISQAKRGQHIYFCVATDQQLKSYITIYEISDACIYYYGLPCRYQAPRAASDNPSSSAELQSFSPQRQRPSSAAYLPLGGSVHTSQWYVSVLYMWAGLSSMLHKAGIGGNCLDLKFTLLFLESMHSTLFSYVLVCQDVIPETWLLAECVWWSLRLVFFFFF